MEEGEPGSAGKFLQFVYGDLSLRCATTVIHPIDAARTPPAPTSPSQWKLLITTAAHSRRTISAPVVRERGARIQKTVTMVQTDEGDPSLTGWRCTQTLDTPVPRRRDGCWVRIAG